MNANLRPTKDFKRGERGKAFRIFWQLSDDDFAIVVGLARSLADGKENPRQCILPHFLALPESDFMLVSRLIDIFARSHPT